MKKNTIKFWFKNRFTMLGVFCGTILVIFGVINDPYLNVFMSVIMLLLVLGVWANLIEDKNANASERLMWRKYSNFIDKLNKQNHYLSANEKKKLFFCKKVGRKLAGLKFLLYLCNKKRNKQLNKQNYEKDVCFELHQQW